MLPGDISSERPVVAALPRCSVQNCPEMRGKNTKQATASGIAMASARADEAQRGARRERAAGMRDERDRGACAPHQQ